MKSPIDVVPNLNEAAYHQEVAARGLRLLPCRADMAECLWDRPGDAGP